MFLTFEFTKTFELSLTAYCVVLKVSACFLKILTFHDGEEEKENSLTRKKKLKKLCIK